MDKTEIIEIAKEIGTFDISIKQTAGCLIVPTKPVTESNAEKVLTMSESIGLDTLAKNCADGAVLHH